MGTKYTSQSDTGYNASPPSDDGTAVASNEVKWSFIKTKLADIVRQFCVDINASILTHTDESVLDKAVTYTTTAADHKRTVNVTAAVTISLADASTVATGYIVTVKNSHSAAITIDLATNTDTLDATVDGSVSLEANDSITFVTVSSADGYISISSTVDTDTDTIFTVQQVSDTDAAYRTSITTMDIDDTLPLWDEGLDTTLSATITPTSATNELKIDCILHTAAATSGAVVIVALFQDASGTDPAIACSFANIDAANRRITIPLNHIMVSGTISPTTFTVRIGASTGDIYLNGSGGARELGGGLISSIVITEFTV